MVEPAKDAVIRGRVLRGTASNYAGQAASLAIGLFLTPFLVHTLGPATYGLWALVGAAVGYGHLLDFGIGGAVIKYVAEYRARGLVAEARSLVATAVLLYAGLGLLAVLAAAALALVFPDLFAVAPADRTTASWLVFLSGLSIGLGIPAATPNAVLRGLHRYDLINLLNTLALVVSTALVVAVLLLGGGVLGIVIVNIAVQVAMIVPSVRLVRRLAPEITFGPRSAERALLRSVLSFSSSLFVIQVASQLQMETDELVIGAALPVSNVTPYALARKLSTLPQLLADQFMKLLLPLASQLHAEEDHARLQALYLMSTRLTLAIFIPVGGALVALAAPILTLWVGPAYAADAYIVVLLTLASLVGTSQWPAASVLQGMGRHRAPALVTLATGVANLGLSVALVGPLGLAGVALGTLIPYALETVAFVLPYAWHHLGVRPRAALAEILLPVALPAVPTALTFALLRAALAPTSLLAVAAVAALGGLVYAAGYLWFGAGAFEREIVRGLLGRARLLAAARLGRS